MNIYLKNHHMMYILTFWKQYKLLFKERDRNVICV